MADALPAADAGLLAAQAASGLQGVEAYKQAQATLQQQKQSAVQTAMQEAALRGAPAGAAESQQSIITQPYDQRLASLAQGQAGFQADMASRDRRMADYNAAIGQARTLIPGQVEMVIAPIRAQGEANIANTTRQGEMAVSEIEARTRLALAQMQAQAAAAARKGGGGGSGSSKAPKLTGTDLEAMLSRGALAQMQGSLASGAKLVVGNEEKARSTKKEARNATTARMIADNPTVNGMDPVAPLAGMATSATFPMAVPGQQRQQPAAATAKPVPPSRPPGMPPEAYQSLLVSYKQKLAAWNAAQTTSTTSMPTNAGAVGAPFLPAPVTPPPMRTYNAGSVGAPYVPPPDMGSGMTPPEMPDPRLAAGAAEQAQIRARYQARMAPYLSTEAEARKLADPSLYSGQYGSITDSQFTELQQSNPWLAAVIGGSPEAITSKNFGALLGGEPDEQGQVSPYSLQVTQAAQEQTLKDLVAQGYDISEADFVNATQDNLKPGETYQQYMQRHTGQLSAQDVAKLIKDQRTEARQNEAAARSAATAARSDADYAQTHNPDGTLKFDPVTGLPANASPRAVVDATRSDEEYYRTHNEDGSPKYDPETGLPVTASPKAQVDEMTNQGDQAATQWLVQNLGQVPPSSFGTPSMIYEVANRGGGHQQSSNQANRLQAPFVDLFQTLQASYPSMVISNKDWAERVAPRDDFRGLDTAQKALLKHMFQIATDKDFPVSAPD